MNFQNSLINHDFESCISILREGFDINNTILTPLIDNILSHDLENVRFLLDNGGDVELEGFAKEKPLYIASVNGNVKICDLLLRNKANINAISSGPNATALYGALNYNKKEVAKFLIEKGADVNLGCTWEDSHFTTNTSFPIEKAIHTLDIELIRLLLENGANPNSKSGMNFLPIIKVACDERFDIAQLLLWYGADLKWFYIHNNDSPFFKKEVKEFFEKEIDRVEKIYWMFILNWRFNNESLFFKDFFQFHILKYILELSNINLIRPMESREKLKKKDID